MHIFGKIESIRRYFLKNFGLNMFFFCIMYRPLHHLILSGLVLGTFCPIPVNINLSFDRRPIISVLELNRWLGL